MITCNFDRPYCGHFISSIGIAVLVLLSTGIPALCVNGATGHYLAAAGFDSTLNNGHPLPIDSDVVKVACGYEFVLYVKSDGTLWAFGANDYGQLGTGDTESIDLSYGDVPVQVDSDVTDVVCGTYHTLYLKSDGSVYAMGLNKDGQLGIGSEDSDTHSTPVCIAQDVSSIDAGSYISFYIDDNEDLYGFGDNYYAGIGDGTRTNAPSPVKVMSNVAKLFCYGITNFCIADDDNSTLYGWGDSNSSITGDVYIGGMLGAFSGLTYFDDSEEGEGGGYGYLAMTPVSLCTKASYVATLFYNSAVITTDGYLLVNGANFYGLLGTGGIDDLTGSSYHPDFNEVDSDVIQFQCNDTISGYSYLKDDGTVWAIGDVVVNYETLAENAYSPVQILEDNGEITNIYDYNESYDYLYTTADGTLWGFGRNNSGELDNGEGDTVYSDDPGKIASNVVEVIIPPTSILGDFFFLTDTQPVDYTYLSDVSTWGWIYTEYNPWYYVYSSGNWIYQFSDTYDGTGYWIFYFTSDCSDYGWGYCYTSGGLWACTSGGTWKWVWYGDALPSSSE